MKNPKSCVSLQYIDTIPGETRLFQIVDANGDSRTSGDGLVSIRTLVGSDYQASLSKEFEGVTYTSPVLNIQVVREANLVITPSPLLATHTTVSVNVAFAGLTALQHAISEIQVRAYPSDDTTVYAPDVASKHVIDTTRRTNTTPFVFEVDTLDPWFVENSIYQHLVFRFKFGTDQYIVLPPVVTQSLVTIPPEIPDTPTISFVSRSPYTLTFHVPQ